MISNQLSDFITKGRVEDLTHVVFVGWPYEQMQEDLKALADVIVDPIGDALEQYLNTKYIPAPDEVVMTDIIPPDLPFYIADLIDTHRPYWNLVQRTTVFHLLPDGVPQGSPAVLGFVVPEEGQRKLNRLAEAKGGNEFSAVIPPNLHNN